jgi:hypothetical protein
LSGENFPSNVGRHWNPPPQSESLQQKSSQCDAVHLPLRQSPSPPQASPPRFVAEVPKENGAQTVMG